MGLCFAVPVIYCPEHGLLSVASATVSPCGTCQSLASDARRVEACLTRLGRLVAAFRIKPDRRQSSQPRRRKDRRKQQHTYER